MWHCVAYARVMDRKLTSATGDDDDDTMAGVYTAWRKWASACDWERLCCVCVFMDMCLRIARLITLFSSFSIYFLVNWTFCLIEYTYRDFHCFLLVFRWNAGIGKIQPIRPCAWPGTTRPNATRWDCVPALDAGGRAATIKRDGGEHWTRCHPKQFSECIEWPKCTKYAIEKRRARIQSL